MNSEIKFVSSLVATGGNIDFDLTEHIRNVCNKIECVY